jgi:hypothetical protein
MTNLASPTLGADRPTPREASALAVACASAACLLGMLYAAISAYWGCGGTELLGSVGGTFAKAGRDGTAGALAVVWFTALLKVIAAAIGLVAIRGHRRLGAIRRRQLRRVSWLVAVVLVLYGGVLSIAGWLVQLGIVRAAAHADHYALRWHAYVWDPWFLAWGLLLSAALLRSRPAVSEAAGFAAAR